VIGFSDLNVLDRVVYTDLTLHSVFMANSHLTKVVLVKFAGQLQLCAVLCETREQVVSLRAHQDGGRPSSRILEILETEAKITEI
jgi:hypothetical protein